MSPWRVIATIGILGVLGACSNTPNGQENTGATTTPSDQTTATTGETTTEPGYEPTTPEPGYEPTTAEPGQPTRKQPSFETANAPIGPGATVDQLGEADKQCVGVSLTGIELREGTTLEFGTPRLDPDKVFFEIDQSACGNQGPSCSDHQMRPPDPAPCYVGVRQTTQESDKDVALIIPAKATCATAEDCKSLDGHGGTQIGFQSQSLGPTEPTGSPSTETSESPEESPSETPTETPTETPSSDG